jgi:hypothetical protein
VILRKENCPPGLLKSEEKKKIKNTELRQKSQNVAVLDEQTKKKITAKPRRKGLQSPPQKIHLNKPVFGLSPHFAIASC